MLCFAFAKRWHTETSSFHLPFGEMIVILDDVSCLLHLPINGMLLSMRVWQRPRLFRWWWTIWGLMRGTHGMRWLIQKVDMHDLTTWRKFSKSVFWSSRRSSMKIIRLRCSSCGSRPSIYICSTWWVSRSSLTRAPTMWMLLIWSTSETWSLSLVMH